MWIHESFTAYSESLFLDYYYGKQAASEYVIGTRRSIQNDRPLIGHYNVNNEGSGDMYYKGANMLHTLRTMVNNDEKWRQILKTVNKKFYHQTVTTQQIENCLAEETGLDLTGFFNQYLRTTKIPVFEYKVENKTLKFRFSNTVDNFKMPLLINIVEKEHWINPTNEWKTIKIPSSNSSISVKKDFYLNVEKI